MLSARKPTFTPAPLARSLALLEPSVLYARIEVRASGSSSGLLGSVGQIWFGAAAEVDGAALALEPPPAAGGVAFAGSSTLLSGTTEATAGSLASAAACSAVTVAENALPSEKCVTLV